jgi:hypothetical protein
VRYTILFILLIFTSSAKADETIFATLISQYDALCSFDADFTIDDSGKYILHFGPNNSIDAYIVNPESLSCENTGAGLCGTRGCPLKVYVQGQTYDMIGWNVSVIQVELQGLLLLEQSGTACDFNSSNAEACYALWEWDDKLEKLQFLR